MRRYASGSASAIAALQQQQAPSGSANHQAVAYRAAWRHNVVDVCCAGAAAAGKSQALSAHRRAFHALAAPTHRHLMQHYDGNGDCVVDGGDGHHQQLEVSEVLGAATASSPRHAARVVDERRHGGDANDPTGADAAATGGGYESIRALDVFARAKILNFIHRTSGGIDTGSTSSSSSSSTAAASSTATPFEVRRVHTFDGSYEYVAKIKLPLLPEDVYGPRYGEGTAPTEKDAEVVAAMHAERVVDALGFSMFQLSSKQQRHAEAARSAGRWAILPGESVRPPPSTPSPPPLQLVVADAKQVVDDQLNDDERRYVSVTDGAFSPLRLTLASSLYVDEQSVGRIRQYLDVNGLILPRCMRCLPLHSMQKRESARRLLKHTTDVSRGYRRAVGLTNDSAADTIATPAHQDELWLVQIRLPLPDVFGPRIASGRASTKKTAVVCACMHAELMLDALGVALYPASAALQSQHAQECKLVGRWATDAVNGAHAKYNEVAPPPLRYVANLKQAEIRYTTAAASMQCGSGHGVSSAATGDTGMPPTDFEQTLRDHAAAVQAVAHVTRLSFMDAEATRDVQSYLARQQPHRDDTTTTTGGAAPFLTQSLGVKGRETFRSTLTVPLPMPVDVVLAGDDPPLSTAQQLQQPFQRNPSAVQRIEHVVAIGIGPSTETSEQCCAMHALLMLGSLGVPLYTHDDTQDAFAARVTALGGVAPRAASQLSAKTRVPRSWQRCVAQCAMKYVGDGTLVVGRVGHSGIMADGGSSYHDNSGIASSPQDVARLTRKCEQSREALSKSSWSLDADTEDPVRCILLHPTHSSDKHSTKYVHTLGSVRTMDVSALTRAQDYLERHGLELSKCWIVVAPAAMSTAIGGGSAPIVTAAGATSAASSDALFTVLLKVPVPVRFGPRQATGMGPTREEAEVLCAMHMELLLDALGVPLYDHVALQVRHSELAASVGRLLVASGSGANALALSGPPPLVKPSAMSVMWLKYARRVHGHDVHVERVTQDPYVADTNHGPKNTSAENDAATIESFGNGSSDPNTPATTAAHPDVALLASMTPVAEGAIVVVLKKYLEQYFARCQFVLEHEVQLSQRAGPTGHPLYHAVLPIPVPERFGRRVARGCASTKRNALHLCIMHGVSTLDALGIPLFLNWEKQRTHADYQRARGIAAPRTESDCVGVPADAPSPPGLKCIEAGADVGADGRVASVVTVPVRPLQEAMALNPVAWTTYVKQCRAYIEAKLEADVYKALMVDRKTPRSGVAIEDEGLSAVEQLRFENGAKGALRTVCASLGFPPPDHFQVDGYGRSPHRCFVARHPVLGTVYTATGSGPDHFSALGRAAMHYIWLLRRLVAGQPSLLQNGADGARRPLVFPSGAAAAATGGAKAHAAVAERIRRADNDAGGAHGSNPNRCGVPSSPHQVLALLKLFAAIQPPAQPLSYAMRERPHPSGSTIHTCTAEVEDDSGLRITGKGESTVDAQTARAKAMLELHRALAQRASMLSLTHRIGMSHDFHANALTVLDFPPRSLREQLQALLRCEVPSVVLPPPGHCASLPPLWRTELQHLFEAMPRGNDAAARTQTLRALVLGEVPLRRIDANSGAFLFRLGLLQQQPTQRCLTPLGVEVQWVLAMLLITLCSSADRCLDQQQAAEATALQQQLLRQQSLDALCRRGGSVWYQELLVRCATCVVLAAKLGCLDAALTAVSHILCSTDEAAREGNELLSLVEAASSRDATTAGAAANSIVSPPEVSTMRRLWVQLMSDATTHSPFANGGAYNFDGPPTLSASTAASRFGPLSLPVLHKTAFQLAVAAAFATPQSVGVASKRRPGSIDFLGPTSTGDDVVHPLLLSASSTPLTYFCATSSTVGERCLMHLDSPWVLFFACGGAPAPPDGGVEPSNVDAGSAIGEIAVAVWDDVPNLATLWNGLLPYALHVSPSSMARAASTPKETSVCLHDELLPLAIHLHRVCAHTPLSAWWRAEEGNVPTPLQCPLDLVEAVLALPKRAMSPSGEDGAPPRVVVSATGRERFVMGALDVVHE